MTIKEIKKMIRQAHFDALEAEFDRDPSPKTAKKFEKFIDKRQTRFTISLPPRK